MQRVQRVHTPFMPANNLSHEAREFISFVERNLPNRRSGWVREDIAAEIIAAGRGVKIGKLLNQVEVRI